MNTIKNYKLELGLMLIYLLPPIGIGAFMVTGWIEIIHSIKKKNIPWSSTTIFFILLLISTVGSSIVLHSLKNLLISLLILGYWGIYLNAKKTFNLSIFNRIKTIVIFGGFYSVLSGFLKPILTKYFIIGFFTGSVYLGSQVPETPRLIGNAFNPNFTAFLLLLSFVFLLSDLVYKFTRSRKRITFARILLLAILVWGLYETASRSVIICMFVLILILSIRANKKIGYFLTFLAIALYPRLLQLIPRTENLKRATEIRTEIWNISVKVWEVHPIFGTTPLGFSKVYTEIATNLAHNQHIYYKTIAHAHNLFLAFLTEYGVVGGIGLAFFVFGIMYRLSAIVFLKEKKGELYEFFYLFLFMILITGIGDYPLASPQLALPTILIVGFWEKYTLYFLKNKMKNEITILPVTHSKKIIGTFNFSFSKKLSSLFVTLRR